MAEDDARVGELVTPPSFRGKEGKGGMEATACAAADLLQVPGRYVRNPVPTGILLSFTPREARRRPAGNLQHAANMQPQHSVARVLLPPASGVA